MQISVNKLYFFVELFANSMFLGKFPVMGATSSVILLYLKRVTCQSLKIGDLYPRPIIFHNLLKRLFTQEY